MEHLGFKTEVEGLWIEDRQSRFKDSISPHHHLIDMFLYVLCRESRYFEDIEKFWIFRLRTIYNFFQVWSPRQKLQEKILLDGASKQSFELVKIKSQAWAE